MKRGDLRACLLFLAALVFLLLIGLCLPQSDVYGAVSDQVRALTGLPWLMGGLWLAIAVDGLLGLRHRSQWRSQWRRLLLVLLVPPARLTVDVAVPEHWIWLPGMGWQLRGPALLEKLERALALPLLLVTAMIVPVMAVELLFREVLRHSPLLGVVLHVATAFIWFSFAFEFTLLVSVAEHKLDYCKQNWINIVIILLPLLAVLRTLRLIRLVRLTRAGKLLRAYRLRGLLVRAQRLVLVFNLVERLLARNPQKHLERLRQRERQKRRELRQLQARINHLETRLAESSTVADQHTLFGSSRRRDQAVPSTHDDGQA